MSKRMFTRPFRLPRTVKYSYRNKMEIYQFIGSGKSEKGIELKPDIYGRHLALFHNCIAAPGIPGMPGPVPVPVRNEIQLNSEYVGVDKYRSPVSQMIVTMIFPLFSGRAATLSEAATLAPAEIPARIPSSRTIRRVVAIASSFVIVIISSTKSRLRLSGLNPAPIPCMG